MSQGEIEILTIEVGSTITKANGFRLLPEGGFAHLAQGFAPTSVTWASAAATWRVGVEQAIADMGIAIPAEPGQVSWPETFVNSSAAGGLRMTVHGLTYSMTARAAREAALGAGAIVKLVTAGSSSDFDLEEIRSHPPEHHPAGRRGRFRRERHRAAQRREAGFLGSANSGALRRQRRDPPARSRRSSSDAAIEMMTAANVFPDVDVLNIEPLRRLIHEVFNRHIIHAPGMARFREFTQLGHPAHPGRGAARRRAFRRSAGRLPGIRRRRGDDRRPQRHRWQPGMGLEADRAGAARQAHRRRRPGRVRQCPQHRRAGRATRPGKPG